MNLLTPLVVLIVIGILLYLINTYLPMDPKIKKIINVFAVVGTIFWVLKVFGVFSYLSNISI